MLIENKLKTVLCRQSTKQKLKALTSCSSFFRTSKLGCRVAFWSFLNWTLFTRSMLWNILGEKMLRKYVPCPEEQNQYFNSTRAASLDVRMVSPT